MRILNFLMILIISTLTIMSLLALISVQGKLINLEMKLTPQGIDNYLTAFGVYKYLFTGTIATCSAYFGFWRVQATIDSNNDKIKQDRFNEWKTIVQIQCNEIESLEPKMTREITKMRRPIFEYLYEKKFKIENVDQLTELFNENVANVVGFFESTNKRFLDLGGIYQNAEYCYSFVSFRFVFYGMLDSWYDDMYDDLLALYQQNLGSERMISESWYQSAVKEQAGK